MLSSDTNRTSYRRLALSSARINDSALCERVLLLPQPAASGHAALPCTCMS
jgi:hypothetical protein